jgi:hypothetical protein
MNKDTQRALTADELDMITRRDKTGWNAPGDVPALLAEIARLQGREAEVWDEGYAAAYHMARCWGHVDHWEGGPENPYDAEVSR